MKAMRVLLTLAALVYTGLADCSFPNANNVTELAVAYQAPALQQLDVADAYKVYICEKGMFQGYTSLRFEMIFPMNPQCGNRNLGCAFIEVYNHSNIISGDPPIATNYVGSTWQDADIVLPWDDNARPVDKDGYLYIKVFGEMTFTLQAEIRVSPTNDPAQGCFYGKQKECYNPTLSPTSLATKCDDGSKSTAPPCEMGNFFQLQALETVPNFSNCLFGLNLCFDYGQADMPDLMLSISSVFANKLDVKEPYSAFNAFVCKRDANPANAEQKYCVPDGSAVLCKQKGACYWDRATPFVNLALPGTTLDPQGKKEAIPLVLSVVGMGGNTNGLNAFIINAELK